MKPLLRTIAGMCLVGLAPAMSPAVAAAEPADDRPRLIVLTDIGGDPDDQQSMVRLMTYANEFQIEGLIASASGTPGELNVAVTRPDLIRRVVQAYGEVLPMLRQHAPGYPAAAELLARVKSGNPQRGVKHIGAGNDTEGSRWIIQVVERPDPRPVNIAIWGGQSDLAQALWRVAEDRGPGGLRTFASRLRIYDIADQDGIAEWIGRRFPGLFYVLAKAPQGRDRREAAFRGMYLGGDTESTSGLWIDRHVRTHHGPLGELYPPKTWTAPNPYSALKEGDTPSWFFFLPNGLSDAEHPDWGGWGGRFHRAGGDFYRDAEDCIGTTTDARSTVSRWRSAFQNDFEARMDWCAKPRGEANHPPTVVLNADRSRRVLQIPCSAGSTVELSAEGSADPDGNELSYLWWIYGEAGSCRVPIALRSADQPKCEIPVPDNARGTTIHVILQVTDTGAPYLTRYRRAILR